MNFFRLAKASVELYQSLLFSSTVMMFGFQIQLQFPFQFQFQFQLQFHLEFELELKLRLIVSRNNFMLVSLTLAKIFHQLSLQFIVNNISKFCGYNCKPWEPFNDLETLMLRRHLFRANFP